MSGFLETLVRIPRMIPMGLIRAYQILVSPLLGRKLPLPAVVFAVRHGGPRPSWSVSGRLAGGEAHRPLPPFPARRLRPGACIEW